MIKCLKKEKKKEATTMMQAERMGTSSITTNGGYGGEVDSFRDIEDLQSAGINVSDIKKLQEFGMNTIGQVLQSSMRELLTVKGLSEAKIVKIRESARKLDSRGSAFKTGVQVKNKRKNVIHITTGSASLDKILGGGLETGYTSY